MEFGISPSSIEIHAEKDEVVCRNIEIFSSINSLSLVLSDRWSIGNGFESDLNKFVYSSSDLNIKITYMRFFNLKDESNVEICFVAEKEGFYRGVIWFESSDGILDIGCWINMYVYSSVKEEKSGFLTGSVVWDLINFNGSDKNRISFYFAVLSSFLLVVLTILLFKLRKVKMREKE
ncbi:MAG: hypothetical protein AABX85_02380 [Nanoarchaeota archaeon]